MEISKEELQNYISEELHDSFVFAIVLQDGRTIAKFGENYRIEPSSAAASGVVSAVSAVFGFEK